MFLNFYGLIAPASYTPVSYKNKGVFTSKIDKKCIYQPSSLSRKVFLLPGRSCNLFSSGIESESGANSN